MRKLVVALGSGYSERTIKQMDIVADVGWDGFFTGLEHEKGNFAIAKRAKELGLFYQSIHAPFTNCDKMWEPGVVGDWEENNLLRCIRHASDVGVELVVSHAIIGFDKFTPNDIGVERYGRVAEEAKKLGVRLAIENTEGDAYFDKVITSLKDNPYLGFCIDTGHEMCYNHSNDLIGKYADKLFCTHLNDNMGQTEENIFWHDDSHLMPFDGIANWEKIAERLNKAGYKRELTFELTSKNKPNRNTHDRYNDLTINQFYALALEKAKKFRSILDK